MFTSAEKKRKKKSSIGQIEFYIQATIIFFDSKWTFVPNLKKFSQGVPEISHLEELDKFEITMNFDLWPSKSK